MMDICGMGMRLGERGAFLDVGLDCLGSLLVNRTCAPVDQRRDLLGTKHRKDGEIPFAGIQGRNSLPIQNRNDCILSWVMVWWVVRLRCRLHSIRENLIWEHANVIVDCQGGFCW